MDPFAKAFVKCSLVYFCLAAMLGAVFMIHSELVTPLRFLHVHLNLFGFMAMMIYGVGYHILPRFHGCPLHSPKLAWLHFWLAQVSLVGMGLTHTLTLFTETNVFVIGDAVFGSLAALSVFIFTYNLWRTMSSVPAVM